MAIKCKRCPKCGSQNSVRIVYGLPSYELFQEAEAGKVKLGGCEIILGNPEFYCTDCEHEWNREQAIDEAYSKIRAIKASVGGYFDGYYNVTIDLKDLKVTWSFSKDGEEQAISKSINAITASKFIEQQKLVDLLNWKAKYIEQGVCDGTHRSVDIISSQRTIHKYGDNKFPVEWDFFCGLIEQITGNIFR